MRPKKRGGVLLAIGLILLVVMAPIVFVLGVWFGTAHAGAKYRTIGSGDTLYLTSRSEVTIYSSTRDSPVDERAGATCTVQAPDGGPVKLWAATSNDTLAHNSGLYMKAGSFDVPSGGLGDYQVTCGPHEAVVTVDNEGLSAATNHVGEGLQVGVVLGLVTGLVGVALAVCGGVMLSRSKTAIRDWDRQQYAAWHAQQYAAWRTGRPGQPPPGTGWE